MFYVIVNANSVVQLAIEIKNGILINASVSVKLSHVQKRL